MPSKSLKVPWASAKTSERFVQCLPFQCVSHEAVRIITSIFAHKKLQKWKPTAYVIKRTYFKKYKKDVCIEQTVSIVFHSIRQNTTLHNMVDTNPMQSKLQEGYSPMPINPATQQTTYVLPPSYYHAGGQTQYAPPPNIPPGPTVVHMVQPYQNAEILGIRDWLPWSITNCFFGWLLGGILPLIFSLMCRSYKRSNNAGRAKTMGILALIFNILVTLAGIGGWIGFIVSLVRLSRAATGTYIHSCTSSIYC